MKSRPRIGEVGELAVPTDMKHAVEFAGDGMPAVVSTPNIIPVAGLLISRAYGF
jgi:hypothetical protein